VTTFVSCEKNTAVVDGRVEAYPDLTVGKKYRVIGDPRAAKFGKKRVVNDQSIDTVYPNECFGEEESA